MKKRTLILGVIFGLLMPVIGIFIGLQVSVFVGNVLTFPIIAISFLTGVPFGMFSGTLWVMAALLSVATWTLFFWITELIIRR